MRLSFILGFSFNLFILTSCHNQSSSNPLHWNPSIVELTSDEGSIAAMEAGIDESSWADIVTEASRGNPKAIYKVQSIAPYGDAAAAFCRTLILTKILRDIGDDQYSRILASHSKFVIRAQSFFDPIKDYPKTQSIIQNATL